MTHDYQDAIISTMRKLIYTFFGYNKRCSRILYKSELPGWDKYWLPRDHATGKLLQKSSEYDLIIGIADRNKNAARHRFDPLYVNKYGRRKIVPDAPESYRFNLKFDASFSSDFYTFTSSTNGPCNRTAFLLMHRIVCEKLDTRLGFFHLCRKIDEEGLQSFCNKLSEGLDFDDLPQTPFS